MPDIISNTSNALLIFARWPEPGRVKTRLSPPLSPLEAAQLYRCMLLDTLERTERIPQIQRVICFDGASERAIDFGRLAPDAKVLRQKGADLGGRLENAVVRAFSEGRRAVAVIGTDCPHMPVGRIEEAFRLLNEEVADVVFGPSGDGGYYLVAMKKAHPELFRDIPWSSSETLERSLEKATLLGLQAMELPWGFDLDTVEDLLRLQENPPQSDCAPRTASFLSRNKGLLQNHNLVS